MGLAGCRRTIALAIRPLPSLQWQGGLLALLWVEVPYEVVQLSGFTLQRPIAKNLCEAAPPPRRNALVGE